MITVEIPQVAHGQQRNDRRLREEADGPIHPIVRKHPDTGRNALYLGRRYASPSSYIVELAQDESEDLLDELWAHATQEKYVWTQVWTPKDTIIWDNRRTMHTRSKVDHTQPREMHRSFTLKGEPVIPVPKFRPPHPDAKTYRGGRTLIDFAGGIQRYTVHIDD